MMALKQVVLGMVGFAGLMVGMSAQTPQTPAQTPARTIDIHAKQFEFVPAEITLKKGETVKLVVYSDDVPHSLAVEGLPIHVGVEKGSPMDVMVTPTETGDFKGRCSKFCGSGHRDMHFVVHVVE